MQIELLKACCVQNEPITVVILLREGIQYYVCMSLL